MPCECSPPADNNMRQRKFASEKLSIIWTDHIAGLCHGRDGAFRTIVRSSVGLILETWPVIPIW